MKTVLTQNRLIYRVKNTQLLIAVKDTFLREIRECAAEYRSLDKVPVHRTVKGVLFKLLNETLSELMNDGSETEICINSLEFDNGTVRSIA